MQTLTSAWETEREEMKKLQAIKAEIDRVNLEVQNAEREYDLNRAAELKYGVLVSLQKQLKAAEEALSTQVRRTRSLICKRFNCPGALSHSFNPPRVPFFRACAPEYPLPTGGPRTATACQEDIHKSCARAAVYPPWHRLLWRMRDTTSV